MLVLDTVRPAAVWQVEFSPDATVLIVCHDVEPQVWVVATGQRSKDAVLMNFEYHTHPSFHPSGRWLLGTGCSMGTHRKGPLVFDLQTRKKWREPVPAGNSINIGRAAFTPDGKAVVYCGFRSNIICQLERRAWEPDGTLGPGWAVRLDWDRGWVSRLAGLAVLADGERLATIDPVPTRGARLALRSLATGAVLADTFFPAPTSPALAVAPDDSLVVTQVQHVLRIWPTAELGKTKARELKNPGRHHFTGIAFHPSGRYLAATSNDTTVRLYDTTTWEVTRTFTWDIGRMRSIAFSPDGTLAAAGSDKGKVVVWDVDL